MPTLIAPTLPAAVELSDAERTTLLDVARRALVAAARCEPPFATAAISMPDVPDDRRGAAFVTLTKHGELRGCVGTLDGSRPLPESVARAAVSAALADVRFGPVRAEELGSIHVEVSVLGPMVRLDDPLLFRPGIDGLLVSFGYAQGLLLPEVAISNGLDASAMLEATCRKAGLPANAWRDPRTRVLAFRTERFGGPALH